MKIRASGVLLHITSLPSPFGIGDLGPWAYTFADLLHSLKQCYWQILPLGSTSVSIGNSPYSSFSAFAGNPLLISPERMVEHGFLMKGDIRPNRGKDLRHVDYGQVTQDKTRLLHTAYDRLSDELLNFSEFAHFCHEHKYWLNDYALFATLKMRFGGAEWNQWPEEFRQRTPEALAAWQSEAAREINYEKFVQFLFYKQWFELKDYCNERQVNIIGDLPIYVTYDSSDVWTNKHLFKLDEANQPTHVAGVPPDYFSKTGQRWGNPVFDWDALKKENYAWWVARIGHNLHLYDAIRLDHFRGFAGYWEIPAEEETAMNGAWVPAAGEDFFTTLCKHYPNPSIIAEDLGEITPDVYALMDRFGFPGMKVLQFGFGYDLPTSQHVPHGFTQNCVVYTGTHDNNTFNGWYYEEAHNEDKERFSTYCGVHVDAHEMHKHCVRVALFSVANTAIFPVQDLLGFGSKHRMNTPSVAKGNWTWRLVPKDLNPENLQYFYKLAKLSGRV